MPSFSTVVRRGLAFFPGESAKEGQLQERMKGGVVLYHPEEGLSDRQKRRMSCLS